MSEERIASLSLQCDGPRDGALLRFSLGNALLSAGHLRPAIDAYRRAVAFDPDYSAAWKLLGKAQLDAGEPEAAADAWRNGVIAAVKRGDKQAEKEMGVFLRRLDKAHPR